MPCWQICKKITLISALSIIATTSNAQPTDPIRCPPLDKIHQAAPLINDAHIEGKLYVAGTPRSAFQDSNLYWRLSVPVIADSKNAAIMQAQQIATHVSAVNSETAIQIGSIYSCTYFALIDSSMGIVIAKGTSTPGQYR